MTKSELISSIADKQEQLSATDVEMAIKVMLQHMTETLEQGRRVEIRGFGSFSLHFRKARTGRNPRTGEAVHLPIHYVPHFKPGKELREEVNASLAKHP